jgi:glyoxalase family protein
MPDQIVGLHHVTAIASYPQQNLDFYTDVMGLRLVKRTVNFDDPGSYHFYFGDDAGTPGTILTFFAWPDATRGVAGAGEVIATAFAVPLDSLGYWEQRIADQHIAVERLDRRFDEEAITFLDPDGMRIEIVGKAHAGPMKAPRFASVPPEHAIRGFFGVTLLEQKAEQTAATLNMMGFKLIGSEGSRLRFATEGHALGNHIDLLINPDARFGRGGAGSVHHIAFRAKDDASQAEWKPEIEKHLLVSPIRDRVYFHSIYFREPGGVLFELATDPPGFTLDEPIETLGDELRIPPWLESQRGMIERQLLPVALHRSMPPLEFQDAEGKSI